jgi:hypothetical protein
VETKEVERRERNVDRIDKERHCIIFAPDPNGHDWGKQLV